MGIEELQKDSIHRKEVVDGYKTSKGGRKYAIGRGHLPISTTLLKGNARRDEGDGRSPSVTADPLPDPAQGEGPPR